MNADMMEVAVVIPLFNGAKWIRQTLQSVAAQSNSSTEVIVVDDGSTDGSPEIIREFSGVRLLRNPAKGVNMARNVGFQHTSAPLVTFLDQDDLWQANHLQLLASVLEKNPECPAAVAEHSYFEFDDQVYFSSPLLDPVVWDPWDWFPFNTLVTPGALLIRRPYVEMMGGYPAQYTGVTDFYISVRLSVAHALIKNQSVTFARRCHETSYSRQLKRQNARSYADRYMLAAEDALNHRIISHHDEQGLSRRRFLILEAIHEIVKRAHELDTTELAALARTLQERVSSESPAYIHMAYANLHWFLYPSLYYDYPHRQHIVWQTLLQYWPVEAEDLRQVVLESIADADTVDVSK